MAKALNQRGPKGPEAAPQSSQVHTVLRMLQKSWPLIVASFLACSAGSLLYSKSLPKIYEATALLQFDPDPPRPMSKESDPFRAWTSFLDNQEIFETQFRVISSENILSEVARNLSLTTDPRFIGGRKGPVPVEDVTGILRGSLKVDPIKNTRLFNIVYQDTDPKQARRICEAIARTFIDKNLEKETLATSNAVNWLSTQTDSTKKDLESSESALQDFKRTNELPSSSIDEVSKMVRLEMNTYDGTLTTLRLKKEELSARVAELTKITAGGPDVVPSSELLANTYLSALRSAYLQGVRERDELLASGKGERHPQVLAADVKIDQAKHAFLTEIDNIRDAVRHDLAMVEQELHGDAELYDQARRKAIELNLKEIEYRRLDRVRVEDEKLYGDLMQQLKGADLSRLMSFNTVLLVDPPLEPKGPVRPNIPVNVLIGAASGLVLGLLLMLLREQLDTSVRAPEDVEKQFGLVFLGLLPQVAEDDEEPRGRRSRRRRPAKTPAHVELVVHANPLGGVAESARSVRTNLMFMNPDHPFRKLLVSSAAPAEGKTTVACSIAIAFAQGGQRVCIVDCDLRRPRLHRIFDRVGDVGVTSVLVGDATVDEVAKPTAIDNLWAVPAGPLPPNPADILHSERFRRFLEALSERFDRVIIDSPPLVAVTDSAIISTLVDGTVFVVRAGKTSKHVSGRGLRALRDVDARVVGVVLNGVDLRRAEYAYYYRYYYYRRPEPVASSSEETSPAAPPN
jgi:capsular exopolysaccharide synthesis family protein